MNGGAVVLLERLLFQVGGHGVIDLGSGGNSRRESFDVNGGAGVLLERRQLTARRATLAPISTRAAAFGWRLATCTAARSCCWSVDSFQLVGRDCVGLVASCV